MPIRNLILVTLALTKYILLVLLAVYCQITSASDSYTIDANTSSTSDDIELNEIQFRYISNRRKHFWPYIQSAESDWDWGIDYSHYQGQADATDFTGQQLQGIFAWHYSDTSFIEGRVGIHRLEVPDLSTEDDQTTHDLRLQLGITRNLKLEINVAENFVYNIGLQPAGIKTSLTMEKQQAGFEWQPTESIRIIGTGSRWDLSDTNQKRENKAKFLYGISPGWPWIWMGASYEKLEYENAAPDYWTPKIFRSIGLVFESSFPITKGLSGSFSASLSNIKEDDNPEGSGGSVIVGFENKLTKTLTLRFSFNRIKSSQENSDWTENSYSLSLNGSF